jgi:hypothetical protein
MYDVILSIDKNMETKINPLISNETKINPLISNKASDYESVSGKLLLEERKNKHIIKALDIGLLFLDSDYTIQKDYSLALEEIINQKNLADKNFIEILANKVPEKVINDTREYLEFMFREELDEEIINEMNPLIKSEFHFENEWGIWEFSKHLSFEFERIILTV